MFCKELSSSLYFGKTVVLGEDSNNSIIVSSLTYLTCWSVTQEIWKFDIAG